ncbi:MAG: GPR endopeptidase [Lachnospiraceae bacterium]|jgi:spore protease|nr:GPR endopeptidase [Lachnospiraceae bacterium]MCI8997240.1 GPR endopeptidase [Lachnospiraceae bacterium]MCI9133712.1 GPR endopeptidase [Lachnospiraceae bacterium]
MDKFQIRTDLALEARESFEEDDVEIRGVSIEEDYDKRRDIRVTRVRIETENGARAMGKPVGDYLTLEAPGLSEEDEDYHREVSEVLARYIRELVGEKEQSILVVGLGNRDVTPDALGPWVVNNLMITRHIIREYGVRAFGKEQMHQVSAIVPGVMAQTGMETFEIVKGIVEETHPDWVIAIDALAARSSKRLNRTIQLCDAGINPGSGVGNHRNGLTRDNLGVPILAIGVPTVVDAATIIYDATGDRSRIAPNLNGMFVTPKNVDEMIKRLSYTISEAINIALDARWQE